jgi:sortase (surface protein transpeptidase)
VILGHVDSKTGPDVFFHLREVRVGDRILVPLADGSRLAFVVQAIEIHHRARFPTSRVYGTDGTTELRLITCTGRYDSTRGGYQDNVVVFARLADGQ